SSVDPVVEIAHDARGDAPDITVAERHGVIFALDAFPFAAAALVIFRGHQKVERHFEGLGDLARIEREREIRAHTRDRRQDAKTREGQIKIEIAERLDQRRGKANLFPRLAQRRRHRALVAGIDLAARKGYLAGVAWKL